MPLIKWEPHWRETESLQGFRQEVDRLFDACFRHAPAPGTETGSSTPGEGFALKVDLEETDQELVLTADVPGVSREDLDLNVTEGKVILQGVRKAREETKDMLLHRQEIGVGPFHRAIDLPTAIVPGRATAKVEEGLLTLTLPKAQSVRARIVMVRID